jgi:hypothetical protein
MANNEVQYVVIYSFICSLFNDAFSVTQTIYQRFSNCGARPLRGRFCLSWGVRGFIRIRDMFILNKIEEQGDGHFAWLKYLLISYLLVQVLASNYKQLILSPAKVSFLSVSQHADK